MKTSFHKGAIAAIAATVLFCASAYGADKFGNYQVALEAPYTGGFPITKSDVTVFSQPTRGIWVGGTGDLAVTYLDGTTDIIQAVPAGMMLRIRATQVLNTGTTATKISGLY